jgi:hypothetical protein
MDSHRRARGQRERLAGGRARKLLTSSASAIVLVVAVIVFSLLAGSRARAPRPGPISAGAGAAVTSARLPSAGLYQSLSLAHGQLVLSGGPAGSPLSSAPAPARPGLCRSAVVDPRTLALSRQAVGPCNDPRIFSEQVLPVENAAPGVINGSTFRVARALPDGKPSTGPVLLRYTALVGTEPEVVYGAGYMWAYVPLAERGGQLLVISQATGLVAGRVSVPEVSRPLLFANKAGLWFTAERALGPPVEPGLYHVGLGLGAPELVVKATGLRWLAGWGQTLWVGTTSRRGAVEYRVGSIRSGPQTLLWRVDVSPALGQAAPVGTVAYLGAPENRIWAVTGGPCTRSVLEADPAATSYKTVASLPAPPGCDQLHMAPVPAPLVIHATYMFVLQPWGPGRFGAIYRIGLTS